MQLAQQQNFRQILLLAALLLFLPLAQAEHFEQHHSLADDIHCQIVHSTTDIDDFKNTLVTKAACDAIESQAPHYFFNYHSTSTAPGNIRAPPTNR